jgi:hypothetical protein
MSESTWLFDVANIGTRRIWRCDWGHNSGDFCVLCTKLLIGFEYFYVLMRRPIVRQCPTGGLGWKNDGLKTAGSSGRHGARGERRRLGA